MFIKVSTQRRGSLTLSNLGNIFSGWHIEKKFPIFPENTFWHSTQLFSNGENLHEMPNPVFLETLKKELYYQIIICRMSTESGKGNRKIVTILSTSLGKTFLLVFCLLFFFFCFFFNESILFWSTIYINIYFLIDYILSETICLFCFRVLFSNINP